MGIRASFRLHCCFCGASGPERKTDDEAVRAGATCAAKIVLIYRCFYGNEVFSCAKCLAEDPQAKEFSETSQRD